MPLSFAAGLQAILGQAPDSSTAAIVWPRSAVRAVPPMLNRYYTINLLKVAAGDNLPVGPILLGAAKPVNILTPTATVRRIANITALTVVETSSRTTE